MLPAVTRLFARRIAQRTRPDEITVHTARVLFSVGLTELRYDGNLKADRKEIALLGGAIKAVIL